MMHPHSEHEQNDHVFSLAQANQLLPKLRTHLTAAHEARALLARIKPEIQRASDHADLGGGSPAGVLYLRAIQHVNHQLQAIHELGVLVKDLDLGLCDFPYRAEGRIVYLCWKLGEEEISWWHETTAGFKERQPLSELDE
jgi:hypothetical protein